MSLTANCSPQTYQRVQTDYRFRLQVTHQLLSEPGNKMFNEVNFVETNPSQTEVQELADNSNESCVERREYGSINVWQDSATKLMLSLVEELRPKLGKSINVKTKGKKYQVIAEKMSAEGYSFTPTQIENKFRGLERVYRKTVLHNRQTGRDRQTCSYESELFRILGEKKGINPEFVLDSAEAEGIDQLFLK